MGVAAAQTKVAKFCCASFCLTPPTSYEMLKSALEFFQSVGLSVSGPPGQPRAPICIYIIAFLLLY